MIKAIVAMRNGDGGIGYQGGLPWKISADLRWFKKWTDGCMVVMGYNTAIEFQKPLPNRVNLVIVNDVNKDKLPKGFIPIRKEDALTSVKKLEDIGTVYIIGGAKTYKLFEEIIDYWIVTHVEAPLSPCDTFLDLDLSNHTTMVKNLLDLDIKSFHKVHAKDSPEVLGWYYEIYLHPRLTNKA